MNVPCQYPYQVRPLRLSLAVLFAAVCAYFAGYKAMTNEAGLIINGIFTFDSGGATIFYWVMAVLAGFGTILGALGLLQSFTSPKTLKLDAEGLDLPHGFLLSKTTRIQYSLIRGLAEQQVSNQIFLYITTSMGRFSLVASMLPNNETYAEIKAFLASKLQR